MRFRGEVQHGMGLERAQQFRDLPPVADITLLKAVMRIVLDRPQRGEVGGIGQFVEIEHIGTKLPDQQPAHRRPDKSGAAGHQYFHPNSQTPPQNSA